MATEHSQRAIKPTLHLERQLQRAGQPLVAGVDEVGRGALAGPVSVGVVVVDPAVRAAPVGLRDSKLLTPAARERLEPALRRWATAWAVGHAHAYEIDQIGIIAALRLAAQRAFAKLDIRADVAILDGNYNYLRGVAARNDPQLAMELPGCGVDSLPPASLTRIRADQTCSAVAAASVLAKCQRDRMMVELHDRHPEYAWAHNKGYAAPEHQAALLQHGPCSYHRLSWRLTGTTPVGADPQQTLLEV